VRSRSGSGRSTTSKQVEQPRRAAHNQRFDLWERADFDRFSNVMRQFIASGIARLTSDVVSGHLTAAGYRVIEQRRVAYEIDGQRFEGFPFLIAEAPRG
jgi:hypothetical protein